MPTIVNCYLLFKDDFEEILKIDVIHSDEKKFKPYR